MTMATKEPSNASGPPSLLRVAIVGRPNVGKSALFNRLTGRRIAIVEESSGVTRDRLHARVEWTGRVFELIDTGGLASQPDELEEHIARQVGYALEQADLLLFVVDGIAGRTPLDDDVAARLRTVNKPVWLLVTKADTQALDHAWMDFASYGWPRQFTVSSLHGRGIGSLLDAVVGQTASGIQAEPSAGAAIAIVGRPNAGKSSLVNALIGEERSIVSNVPGTTRDAVDVRLNWTGKVDGKEQTIPFVLIDTAGIRRRKQMKTNLDFYSISRAEKAINRASVAILIVDATEGVTATDKSIASLVAKCGTACVIAVNKWDLMSGKTDQRAFSQWTRQELPFLAYAPLVFISAKEGTRLDDLMHAAYRVHCNAGTTVTTGVLNRALHAAFETHPPPLKKGRRLAFRYAAQTGTRPPRFTLFVNDPARVQGPFENHVVNVLRAKYGFEGTPVLIYWKESPDSRREKR